MTPVSNQTLAWIKKVVEGIDAHTDAETCARILEACGRQCTPQSLVKKARRIFEDSKDIGEFLARFSDVFEAIQIEDDTVYVVYPQCYCEQIKGIPIDQIPNAYCNCSVGWVKELFEGALGRPIQVERVKSVVAGDEECRFKVNLS